jgi:hypothetical protein
MFQITVSEKLVKRILGSYVEDQMFEFSNKDLKAAGVPTRAQIIEQILADEGFQKALSKRLAVFVNDGDAIHDAMEEMPMPAFEAVLKKLGAVA